eukprot:5515151-Amphidinium_carterae.1
MGAWRCTRKLDCPRPPMESYRFLREARGWKWDGDKPTVSNQDMCRLLRLLSAVVAIAPLQFIARLTAMSSPLVYYFVDLPTGGRGWLERVM